MYKKSERNPLMYFYQGGSVSSAAQIMHYRLMRHRGTWQFLNYDLLKNTLLKTFLLQKHLS